MLLFSLNTVFITSDMVQELITSKLDGIEKNDYFLKLQIQDEITKSVIGRVHIVLCHYLKKTFQTSTYYSCVEN